MPEINSKILADSEVALNLRYRYEFVDQEGIPENADASTLRSRITLQSGRVSGFQGVVEVDNVSYIGNDNFNNRENGTITHPVVADPDYTESNQAYISYDFNEAIKPLLVARALTTAASVFSAGVSWRQNEQTFDAARLTSSPLDGLNIDDRYIWAGNCIFGPGGADGEFEGDNHALIASYKITEGHSLSAFAYFLDFDESATLSSKTFGLGYQGGIILGETTWLGIKFSAAEQRNHGDNAKDFVYAVPTR